MLLVQRGQAPAKGQWTLPGGAIDLGESPESALKREVKEECQLDITVGQLVTIVNKIIRDEQKQIRYHYLILDYLACCRPGKLWRKSSPQPGSDVMDARWVAIETLGEYDFTEGLPEVIAKAVTLRDR